VGGGGGCSCCENWSRAVLTCSSSPLLYLDFQATRRALQFRDVLCGARQHRLLRVFRDLDAGRMQQLLQLLYLRHDACRPVAFTLRPEPFLFRNVRRIGFDGRPTFSVPTLLPCWWVSSSSCDFHRFLRGINAVNNAVKATFRGYCSRQRSLTRDELDAAGGAVTVVAGRDTSTADDDDRSSSHGIACKTFYSTAC